MITKNLLAKVDDIAKNKGSDMNLITDMNNNMEQNYKALAQHHIPLFIHMLFNSSSVVFSNHEQELIEIKYSLHLSPAVHLNSGCAVVHPPALFSDQMETLIPLACSIFFIKAAILYSLLYIFKFGYIYSSWKWSSFVVPWKRINITALVWSRWYVQMKPNWNVSCGVEMVIIRESHKPIWQQSMWTAAAALEANLYSWMGGECTNSLSTHTNRNRHVASLYSERKSNSFCLPITF